MGVTDLKYPEIVAVSSQSQRRKQTKKALIAYLFLLPYLLIFGWFLFGPALMGLGLSFTRWEIIGLPEWVGLENFSYLWQDSLFWMAFRNTLYFTMMTVPPLVAGGLGLATLLNLPLKGRTVPRTLSFIPYVMMVTIIGILWRWIYDRNFGLLNYYLGLLFDIKPVAWLTSADFAMLAVAITSVWWQVGTNMVIYLAGLQEIPEELYDAAKVDGANAWQRFWHITLPGLYLVHIFVIPMSIITSMRVFGQVVVMTQGGPFGSTYTLVQDLYARGWVNFRMGEAAAVGVILFLLTFAFTVVQLRAFKVL